MATMLLHYGPVTFEVADEEVTTRALLALATRPTATSIETLNHGVVQLLGRDGFPIWAERKPDAENYENYEA